MRFVRSITVHRPLPEVWAALTDPGFMPRWQPSLQTVEPLAGTPGQVGAVTRLVYHEAGREVVLTETVTVSEAPRELATRYKSSMVDSTLINRLTPLPEGGVRWDVACEFQFHGMLRFLGSGLRGATERRIEGDMARFKELLEGSTG
ncbi:MAG TPA: SRPBCC family protein [Thermoanaerobaculia bacterium]|nr:SRPBCC family protein [Thermoanaerobaculia bacterium]